MLPVLYFVLPCYNEEAVLPISAPVLRKKLDALIAVGKISPASRILFVDDGSSDLTWAFIQSLHAEDASICGIKLCHNVGEQNAYFAGISEAAKRADVIVTADCDLQDDISAVDEMLDRFEEGNEIVYGVRCHREEDSWFQRFCSTSFYFIMKKLGTELIPEHSQYRLMSRRAAKLLLDFNEVNLFLPALVPKIGLQHTVVEYDRHSRAAGKSNYSTLKLFRLATDAVTSFSAAPLAFITIGAVLSSILFLVSFICLVSVSVSQTDFSTIWALFSSLWLIATLLLCSARILGEYLYKTYLETKKDHVFKSKQC